MKHHRRLPIMASLLAILIATLAISAAYGQADCTEALSGDGTVNGEWTSSCESEVPERGYARYYTFTMAQESEVTIELNSEVDTYLYLREGSATSGTALHENDDIESGSYDSRIVADLDAGAYTIEATTYAPDTEGNFTLTVSGLGGTGGTGSAPGFYRLTGPRSGHFHHEPDDGRIEKDRAGVEVYNVRSSALFENPYDGDQHDFSFGFRLRVGQESSAPRIIIHSDGWWNIRLVNDETIHHGQTPSLRTSQYSANYLSIAVVGEYAAVALNGEPLTDNDGRDTFHVGEDSTRGDVWIVTGAIVDTEQDGAISPYELFEVERIIPEEPAASSGASAREALELLTPKDIPVAETAPAAAGGNEYHPDER